MIIILLTGGTASIFLSALTNRGTAGANKLLVQLYPISLILPGDIGDNSSGTLSFSLHSFCTEVGNKLARDTRPYDSMPYPGTGGTSCRCTAAWYFFSLAYLCRTMVGETAAGTFPLPCLTWYIVRHTGLREVLIPSSFLSGTGWKPSWQVAQLQVLPYSLWQVAQLQVTGGTAAGTFFSLPTGTGAAAAGTSFSLPTGTGGTAAGGTAAGTSFSLCLPYRWHSFFPHFLQPTPHKTHGTSFWYFLLLVYRYRWHSFWYFLLLAFWYRWHSCRYFLLLAYRCNRWQQLQVLFLLLAYWYRWHSCRYFLSSFAYRYRCTAAGYFLLLAYQTGGQLHVLSLLALEGGNSCRNFLLLPTGTGGTAAPLTSLLLALLVQWHSAGTYQSPCHRYRWHSCQYFSPCLLGTGGQRRYFLLLPTGTGGTAAVFFSLPTGTGHKSCRYFLLLAYWYRWHSLQVLPSPSYWTGGTAAGHPSLGLVVHVAQLQVLPSPCLPVQVAQLQVLLLLSYVKAGTAAGTPSPCLRYRWHSCRYFLLPPCRYRLIQLTHHPPERQAGLTSLPRPRAPRLRYLPKLPELPRRRRSHFLALQPSTWYLRPANT
ncbi:hypothetical protein C7M84_022663 [Penaeus vannamei]|uniref:Uncharacterized protein n=1 Tax=Penaeus vannamei TaxID=6689 RepID=A0A423U643_PENVA|nr:hypothetical protein C7M84_022663 [Penaeus vannamei]